MTEQFRLRRGGTLTVSEDRLLVDRPDGQSLAIDPEDVVEVSLQGYDYFLVVMSLALAGFGLLSLSREFLLAFGFVAAGIGSLVLTYRKRYALRIRVAGRTDPVRIFPADPEACLDALAATVQAA